MFSDFHFENQLWLWGTLLIPTIWLLYALLYRKQDNIQQLRSFIDEHLLQHLLLNKVIANRSIWTFLLLWSILWALLMAALAGPRWNYKEVDVFRSDQSLAILLDLSQSMNAEDEKPSRITRAKQEIEDILRRAKGVKIALIAFAADPHMINPLTDDMQAILHLLPSLDTDLVYVQGSRLSPAFEMASRMLTSEPGSNKSILVITDGGFEDASAIATASELAAKGIVIHTMGIGSQQGAPIKDIKGNFIKNNNAVVISKLEAEKLKEVSKAGGGNYIKIHYSDTDSRVVLNQLADRSKAHQVKKQITKHWEEHFYLLLWPVMLILLFWFRKGRMFPVVFLFLYLPAEHASAAEIGDYFRNDQQLGEHALERGDYDTATRKFKDPYRQGVAYYKAGNFTEAENTFKQSTRSKIKKNAAYNLGNAQAKQQKYDEAIKTYESLLEQYPNHEKAKHNLEVIKKLRDQQQKDQSRDQQNQDTQDQGDTPDEKDRHDGEQSSKKENSEQKHPQDSNDPEEQQQEGSDADTSNKEQTAEQNEDNSHAEEDQQQSPEESEQESIESMGADQAEEQQSARTQQDIDADQWLNRITNDPKSFLKNQFYIESKQKRTKAGNNPW